MTPTDMAARDIARQVLDGALDERTGRQELTALACRAQIVAAAVAMSATARGHGATYGNGFTQDLTSRLGDLVRVKVDTSLDLTRIAGGASFTGWVRQLCRSAIPAACRDTRTASRQAPLPGIAHTWPAEAPRPVFGRAADAVDEDGTRVAVIAADYSARRRGARELSVPHIIAGALAKMYTIPGTGRVLDKNDVAELAQIVGRARASKEVLAAIPATPALQKVFARYRSVDLRTLEELPVAVTEALIRSATTPRPGPTKPVTRQVATAVAAVLGDRRAAATLTDAWVTSVAEIDGSEHSTFVYKDHARIRAERAAFVAAATAVLDAGLFGLGDSVEAVDAALHALLDRAESTSAARRAS